MRSQVKLTRQQQQKRSDSGARFIAIDSEIGGVALRIGINYLAVNVDRYYADGGAS